MERASGLVREAFLEEATAVTFSRKRRKGEVRPGPKGGGLPEVFPGWEPLRSADWEEGVGQYGGEGGGERVGPGRAGVGHEKLQHLHCPWHEPGTVHTPLT